MKDGIRGVARHVMDAGRILGQDAATNRSATRHGPRDHHAWTTWEFIQTHSRQPITKLRVEIHGAMSRLAFILLSILLPFILISLSSPYAPTEPFALENARDVPARVLLLTAHPDDECMFFAPTILSLLSQTHTTQDDQSSPEIYSLCLSVGDADGLGSRRARELGRSLDVL